MEKWRGEECGSSVWRWIAVGSRENGRQERWVEEVREEEAEQEREQEVEQEREQEREQEG